MRHNVLVNTLSARYQGLDDIHVIREKVTKIRRSEMNITDIPQHLIKRYIGDLLSNLYIPTTQELALLRKLVHTARAYCELTYRNDQQYLESIYTHFNDFATSNSTSDIPTMICLTG